MVPQKAKFEDYVATCTPFLKIPALEAETRDKVNAIVDKIIDFQPESDSKENLIKFVRQDSDFLQVILSLTNLSQERFRRIVAAEKHARGIYLEDWSVGRIRKTIVDDDEYASRIADLILEGKRNPSLANQVADFYLDQLYLPPNWSTLLRDRDFASQVVRNMLIGNYSVQRGRHVEMIVSNRLDQALAQRQLSSHKGRVEFLGKEVDLAVPGIENPQILIMVSYMETTSSSQTTRANEQETMFGDVKKWNSRNNTRKAFINVVDGGGWLARKRDLKRLHRDSHYCLSLNMLDQLDEIVAHHAV